MCRNSFKIDIQSCERQRDCACYFDLQIGALRYQAGAGLAGGGVGAIGENGSTID